MAFSLNIRYDTVCLVVVFISLFSAYKASETISLKGVELETIYNGPTMAVLYFRTEHFGTPSGYFFKVHFVDAKDAALNDKNFSQEYNPDLLFHAIKVGGLEPGQSYNVEVVPYRKTESGQEIAGPASNKLTITTKQGEVL